MRWGELDHVLVFPDALGNLDDDERMQRGLAKKRIGDLVDYLENADDHFFSALTLIILPRDLERPAEEGDEPNGEWDYYFESHNNGRPGHTRAGNLYLSGDVRLFPADGQHRAKAAIEAIASDPTLAREEVPVVLVPYEGATQVRQLFSDLNLNAKPVSKTIGYDFESRDPVVVISKNAAVGIPLFDGRINRRTNSLPKTSSDVITLSTLVQGSESILKALASQYEYESSPTIDATKFEAYIGAPDTVTEELRDVWTAIVDTFEDEWKPVLDNADGAAGLIREQYLFAHGLGWLALARAAAHFIEKDGDAWKNKFQAAVRSFNWERTAPVWHGNAVLLNSETGQYRVNNTATAVKDLAARIESKA